jgi:hypothetical protein
MKCSVCNSPNAEYDDPLEPGSNTRGVCASCWHELGLFRLVMGENDEFVHIHKESDDGSQCVAQLDAPLAELWAKKLWEAKNQIEEAADE